MILSPVITAFRTLTIIPLPGKDTRQYHLSLLFFPVVGITIGIIHLVTFWILSTISVNFLPLSGMILCALNYILTGALHLDGFADSADAFGTVHDRKKTLDILKDSHLGTFGVTAIVLLLFWRILVYQFLADNNRLLFLLPCLALSRTLQGILLCILPYGRDNTGKAFVFSGKPFFAIFLLIEIILISTVQYFYTGTILSIIPVFTGLLFTIPLISTYLHRIQGITGDGIGASSEIYEIIFLTTIMILQFK